MIRYGRGGSKRPVSGAGSDRARPRVVILDDGQDTRVEVLHLPESAALGASFCHLGASWKVTGTRTGQRVLIAEPSTS